MAEKIIYIMGVSGSGKTTIGQAVSKATGIPFFDGDDFHPESNISKMKSGKALTDKDRKRWLVKLNELAISRLQRTGAVIACSALKESYRGILCKAIENRTKWVYLDGDINTISARMQQREDHFMPMSLLQSQFDTLEPPEYGIHADITQAPEQIVNQIISKLEL